MFRWYFTNYMDQLPLGNVIVCLFTSLRSCTSLYVPSGFFTGNIGVLCGDMHGSKILSSTELLIIDANPCFPSEETGCCQTPTGGIPGLILIFIGGMLNSPLPPPSAFTFRFIPSSSSSFSTIVFTTIRPPLGTTPIFNCTCKS